MKRSEKAKAGPKFRVGQVVCLTEFAMPVGAVVLKLRMPNGMWLGTVEQDNHEDDREFVENELRPLTTRESGQRQRKGKA